MPFLSLSTVHFRNIEDGTIDLSGDEIFLHGENGQGKSNILEALYFLAYGSSFRVKSDSEVVAWGQQDFSIRAQYRAQNGAVNSAGVFVESGKKWLEKNGKRLADRKELINTIPCVLYSHEDLAFVSGEPERRRFFLDQTLSMHDVLYIDVLRQYRKALRSKNLCLKNQTVALLDVYDQQLATPGAEIQNKRGAAVAELNGLFSRLYGQVTGIEGVELLYRPSWQSQGPITAEAALEHLASRRETDLRFGTSCCGPHRDKIIFAREGKDFVPSASTGQRRAAALLLRTAQAVYYTAARGKKPVLLLDDVLLELDPEKRQRITALLPEYDQLFYTFLPEEPAERYRKKNTKEYIIKAGKVYG